MFGFSTCQSLSAANHGKYLIFSQIFVHLKPADLLRLAWVSKSFRQILMTRDSAWLWKEVWNNIPGTPLCPEDMSVPAWTNLLFGGAYCHVRMLFSISNALLPAIFASVKGERVRH